MVLLFSVYECVECIRNVNVNVFITYVEMLSCHYNAVFSLFELWQFLFKCFRRIYAIISNRVVSIILPKLCQCERIWPVCLSVHCKFCPELEFPHWIQFILFECDWNLYIWTICPLLFVRMAYLSFLAEIDWCAYHGWIVYLRVNLLEFQVCVVIYVVRCTIICEYYSITSIWYMVLACAYMEIEYRIACLCWHRFLFPVVSTPCLKPVCPFFLSVQFIVIWVLVIILGVEVVLRIVKALSVVPHFWNEEKYKVKWACPTFRTPVNLASVYLVKFRHVNWTSVRHFQSMVQFGNVWICLVLNKGFNPVVAKMYKKSAVILSPQQIRHWIHPSVNSAPFYYCCTFIQICSLIKHLYPVFVL